jgi:WXG100 family type VII secretion target
MAGQISLTPEQMQARIGEVNQAEQDFVAVFQKMQGMMSNLQTEWQGEASRSFAEQFDRLKTQSFDPMRQLLEDLGKQLTETLRVIQDLDSQIAGKFKG